MLSLKKSSLLAFATSAVQVAAHGHVDWLVTNGVAFRGYSAPEMSWNPSHPPVVGWTNGATDNGYVEPNSFADPDIICHRAAKPGKGHVTVAAGDKITLQWSTWPESHKGPVIDYLARCPGDCETVDKNDLEFFKIGQEGLIDMSMHSGKWAADVLVATGFSWTLQIPKTLASGNYVLRHEIIAAALHGSGQPNGAQNYPQCFNLKVTGNGDLVPKGVKGTQLYKANDPGILFNLYTTPLSYKIPGPTLVPGLPSTVSQKVVAATATSSATVPGQTQASTSSKSSSSTSKGGSSRTSTPVAGGTTLKTSTTSKSSSSSTTKDTPQPTEDDDIICGPATGGLPKYSQCGDNMYHRKPWVVKVQAHPGSTAKEIRDEPDWVSGHQHRVGFRDRNNRLPGLAHKDDGYREEVAREKQKYLSFRKRAKSGELINFRDLIENQKDFHLRHPENRSFGRRYVLNATENWVKNKEPWPANLKKQEEEEKKKKEDEAKSDEKGGMPEKEHEWKRSSDKDQHHDAYEKNKEDEEKKQEKTSDDKSKLSDKYTPAEIALLRALEHEKNYIQHLRENNGKRRSPQHKNLTQISIGEQDQFIPDNWLPRSPDLICLTGKHPLNAEVLLTRLYEAGLITPNELRYVRNHGPVPPILWEFHELEITYDGKTRTLSMDDLKEFDTINIAVALACDGNRPKELNMIKKSKGFNWGAGGASCAYWKGPLLRDVLLAYGVPEKPPGVGEKRYWVNFEGTDDLSEGKYATCIPFEHAMAPNSDVILAYEMNDVPLPPDHGYPVPVIIPGFENESYYHIWDNRVLPSFVTEEDGPFAETLFHHPDTACNEQNLNSVIVRPAQGEKIPLGRDKKGENYRIEGYV
ncbi:nitrate reductase (NADH) [Fusarium coicis]|nr:nitrate reductase (NADH) [Fusarium coicis]